MKTATDTFLLVGIRCRKCGEILLSMHRHDFQWCRCGTTFIDGGQLDYMRYGGQPVINKKKKDGSARIYKIRVGTEHLNYR